MIILNKKDILKKIKNNDFDYLSFINGNNKYNKDKDILLEIVDNVISENLGVIKSLNKILNENNDILKIYIDNNKNNKYNKFIINYNENKENYKLFKYNETEMFISYCNFIDNINEKYNEIVFYIKQDFELNKYKILNDFYYQAFNFHSKIRNLILYKYPESIINLDTKYLEPQVIYDYIDYFKDNKNKDVTKYISKELKDNYKKYKYEQEKKEIENCFSNDKKNNKKNRIKITC